MKCLKERERQILQMRYGIEHEELTQKDIAQRLGISQSYISRKNSSFISLLLNTVNSLVLIPLMVTLYRLIMDPPSHTISLPVNFFIYTQDYDEEIFGKTLINGNLKLVLSIVQRFSSRCENMDDLFQVGCIGLVKSIDNFDLKHVFFVLLVKFGMKKKQQFYAAY